MADLTFTIEMKEDGTAVLKNLQRTAEDSGRRVGDAMKKAASGVESLSANALRAARAIGALVGVGSVAAFATFARSAFNAADSLTDLADQSGHSVKMLLSLEQVTAQYGVSLEELTRSTQFMLRSLVESQQGTNAQAEAMKKLGFTTRDALRFMSDPDGFLQEFAKRLATLPTHAERLAVAQDLASRAGGRLAPVLLDIAQNGLPQVSDETARAYKVMGEWADWLSVVAVKRIQGFNTVIVDMAKTLGLIARGPEDRLAALDRQIATLRERQAHPYHAGRISDEVKLQGLLRDRMDLEEQLLRMETPPAPSAPLTTGIDPQKIESVADALKKQIIGLEGQRIALEKGDLAGLKYKLTQESLAQLNAKTLPASIKALIDSVVAQAAAFEKVKFEQERLGEVTRRTDQDLAEFAKGLEEIAQIPIKEALEQDRLAIEAFAQSVGTAFDALDAERGREIQELSGRGQRLGQVLTDLNERQYDAQQLSTALGNRFDLTSALIDVQRQRVEALVKEYGALSPKVKEAVDELDRLKNVQATGDFFRNIGNSITRGIADTLRGIREGTQSLTAGLQNMLRNVLLSVAEAVNDKLLIQPIKEIVNGFLEGLQEAFASASNNAAAQIARDLGLSLGNALKGIFGQLGIGGGFGGGIGGIIGSIGSIFASLFHNGGLIGAPAMAVRQVNPIIFHNARRLHGGGLVAGERPIIGRDDEFVVKGSTVRSIGVAKLREINETGRLPATSSPAVPASGGSENVKVTLDFKGAQIIPRAPWTTPSDVVKVTVKNLKDMGGVYGAIRQYGPK